MKKFQLLNLFIPAILFITFASGCSSGGSSNAGMSEYTYYFAQDEITGVEYLRTYKIPHFEGDVGRFFNNICFEYPKELFHLSGEKGMAEFYHTSGNIEFDIGFTAETKEYVMSAFSCNPIDGKITALDQKGRQIVTSYPHTMNIPLPKGVATPVGMCEDEDYIWVCDKTGVIFKMKLVKDKLKVITKIGSPVKSPTGMAWDGHHYWVCSKDEVARFNSKGEVFFKQALEKTVDGICIVKGDMWAIAYNKPEIYRFSLLEGSVVRQVSGEE
ncbi:MAG: hypothetical protein ABIG42_02190 [bacterium]